MNIFSVLNRAFVLVVLVIALSFALTGCVSTDVSSGVDAVQLMVRFDQAYIPFLAMTSKGEQGASIKAMGILSGEWSVLRPEIQALYPDDNSVGKYLAEVDSTLSQAFSEMGKQVPLIEVHEILEGVKKPLTDLRRDHGIEYYPDLLDEYHTVMEEILTELGGKSADQLNASDLQLLQTYAENGSNKWNIIASAEFNQELYGFSAEKAQSLQSSIVNAQKQESAFLEMVEAGDVSALMQESTRLKGAYTQVYLQFGNFDRLKS